MARARKCLVLAIAVLASGCSEDVPSAGAVDGDCRSFSLGGSTYRMRLPAGASFEQDASRAGVMIRPNPKGRLVRFLALAPLAGATLPPPTDNATLDNGLTLSYALEIETGGGSGGPEAELNGELLLDARTPVMVVCHDQREGQADATWCLEPLGTLAAEGAPEACR